jgi:hypothetical protein
MSALDGRTHSETSTVLFRRRFQAIVAVATCELESFEGFPLVLARCRMCRLGGWVA